jgi:YVTN family beta-propeller protein
LPYAPASGSLDVDPVTGYVYVTTGDRLILYDPQVEQILAEATVGAAPGQVLLDDAGGSGARRVFVVSPEWGAVLALDAQTLEQQGLASGFALPGGLALAGDRLFVADTAAGTLVLLDAATLQEVGRVAVGPGPFAVASLPDMGRVFVALSGGNGIAVLDATTGELLATTPLGGLGHPQGLVVDAARGQLYAVYALSPRYRQIALLEGATGALVRVLAATLDRTLEGAEALALDTARGRLLVSASDGLFAYDLDNDSWSHLSTDAHIRGAPVFGLAADSQRGVLYAAMKTDAGLPFLRLGLMPDR